MFGLVEEPQRGVPGAVRPDGDQVLQVLQTGSEVSTAVLLQLIVGRSASVGLFGRVFQSLIFVRNYLVLVRSW